MRRPHAIAPLAVALTAVTRVQAACASSPAESAPTNETAPTTPAPAGPMDMNPDERHECGQVSALQAILYRSQWEHDQGIIDDVAYASRIAAVEDGWTYLAIGGTEVTPSIKAAQRAMGGGIGPENTEFSRAVEEVARTCDAAGSLIAIGALPGQGG